MKALLDKVWLNCVGKRISLLLALQVQAYEDKIDCLEKDVASHKEEISGLKSTVAGMTG